MNKSNWLIKQGTAIILVSFALSILSFMKEAVFANYFGTTSEADAYTIAIQVPEILFAVVWEAVNAVVIPLYTNALVKKNNVIASIFISKFLTIITILSVLFVVVGEFFCDNIIFIFAPGLDTDTHHLAVSIMQWIFPALIFEGFVRIGTAVLNVKKYSFSPE